MLPFHIEADRYWEARSWDRTQVPKPYARAAIAVEEPILVPPGAGDDVLEAKRVALEQALLRARQRSAAMLEPR